MRGKDETVNPNNPNNPNEGGQMGKDEAVMRGGRWEKTRRFRVISYDGGQMGKDEVVQGVERARDGAGFGEGARRGARSSRCSGNE
jgi:hypothetical protein